MSKNEQADSTEMENEQWRTLKAKDHFRMTEREWSILEKELGSDSPTVGDMADLANLIEHGVRKLAGFGDAKLEKIMDQLEEIQERERRQA